MTELEKAAVEAFKQLGSTSFLELFKAGARWQYEQFEKNRLTACDNMTKEEADREQKFTTDFIEKNLRAPTYSDAIEYGRKQVINKAIEFVLTNFQCDGPGYPLHYKGILYEPKYIAKDIEKYLNNI